MLEEVETCNLIKFLSGNVSSLPVLTRNPVKELVLIAILNHLDH